MLRRVRLQSSNPLLLLLLAHLIQRSQIMVPDLVNQITAARLLDDCRRLTLRRSSRVHCAIQKSTQVPSVTVFKSIIFLNNLETTSRKFRKSSLNCLKTQWIGLAFHMNHDISNRWGHCSVGSSSCFIMRLLLMGQVFPECCWKANAHH